MPSDQIVRDPSHAGSWYSSSKTELNSQLDGWLANVKEPVTCIGPQSEGQTVSELPVPGARVIIAPHAGYSYSGPTAAWAYKAWDVSSAKRVFLLGPSHHFHLSGAALTKCTHYATPLGNLPIDRATTTTLHKTGHFDWMSQSVDEDEHSLEMHLPYIFKMMSGAHGPNDLPPLVPILIGSTSPSTERSLGRLLAPYLADPANAFVISSDFAHWGSRFRYTYYEPSPSPSNPSPSPVTSLRSTPRNPPIHESIEKVDFASMGACESASHEAWLTELGRTGNTVCGRHPIGVVMAGLEEVAKQGGDGEEMGRFRFVRYERSGKVERVGESSVSYASAFAVL